MWPTFDHCSLRVVKQFRKAVRYGVFKLLMVINKKLLIIVNNVYVCQSSYIAT